MGLGGAGVNATPAGVFLAGVERECYDLGAVKTNVLYYDDNLDTPRNFLEMPST